MIFSLFQDPVFFVLWVGAILIALSAHEFSHALAANALGDQTAKRLGRLTLNPVSHIDLFGLVTLVTVGFGWGKPVPFNPYNLKNQSWGPVVIALAGPGMNLFLGTVMALLLRVLLPSLGDTNLLVQFLMLSIYLNLSLLLFNLIPIPPLDGSKLLLAMLPGPAHARTRLLIETRGPVILFGVIIADMLLKIGIFSWFATIIQHFIRIVVGV